MMNCRWKHSGSVSVAVLYRDDEINGNARYNVLPSGWESSVSDKTVPSAALSEAYDLFHSLLVWPVARL